MKLVTIIIVFSHFVFTLSYLESIPCQASTLYNAHDTLEHPLRAVVRDSSQSGACPQTTESPPPPLEEALFSLKSINLHFLYPTYLILNPCILLCDESNSRAIQIQVQVVKWWGEGRKDYCACANPLMIAC